jgi:5-methylcytosine-specific restriction endonuclease McrA
MSNYYALIRAEVKAEYRNTCQLCFEKFESLELQIHHILRRSDGGRNNKSNLIPLCGGCHIHTHLNHITHNKKGHRVMYLRPFAQLRVA